MKNKEEAIFVTDVNNAIAKAVKTGVSSLTVISLLEIQKQSLVSDCMSYFRDRDKNSKEII